MFSALRGNPAVIPAQAGIHNLQTFGICGNGDAHLLGSEFMDSRLRGNDRQGCPLHTLRNKC